MVRAVKAAVYAVIRKIKGCKHNYSVAVNFLLYIVRGFENFVINFLILAQQQGCCFLIIKSAAVFRLIYYLCQKRLIIFVFLGIIESCQDFAVINKLNGIF